MTKLRTDVTRLFETLKIDVPFGYREFDESSETEANMRPPVNETANIAIDNPVVAEPDKDRIIPISVLSHALTSPRGNSSTIEPIVPSHIPKIQIHDKVTGENVPNEAPFTEQVTATDEANFQKDRWAVLRALAAGHSHLEGENQGSRIPLTAVYSPQGGAGVTTISASLAWSLGQADGTIILVEMGGLGFGRLFFGLRGEEVSISDGSATALVGRMPGSARRATYLNATISSGGISPLLDSLMPPGGAPHGEHLLSDIFARVGGPSHIILDVPAGRWDLWERASATADFAIIPLRCDLSALLAVDALLTEMSVPEHIANRRLHPVFVLNQFDPTSPLHQEIAQVLKGRLGDMLAPFSIPHDEHLEELLASGDPFVESIFQKHAGLLAELLITCPSCRVSLP